MTGEEWLDEQVKTHRTECDTIADLLNDNDGEPITGAMVSDALAIAGLNIVPVLLPPWMLFQETYCDGERENDH